MERCESISVPQEDVLKQREFMRLVTKLNAGRIKYFNLQTLGCQMNENDSEKLSGMLEEMGYLPTDDLSKSDLIIYNTCCVRENAEQKIFGHLGALKKLKRQNPELLIALCGCMMQQKEAVEHIKKTYRHVDLIFGTHNLYKFPELLYEAANSRTSIIDVWGSNGSIVEGLPVKREDSIKAWVTIMYGCNNFCSYCIVPYVRGRERSRIPGNITEEIKQLGNRGFKEVTLLGQNVNSYGKDLKDGYSFAKLLYEIDGIDGIERVRFMTSHPKDLSDELIEAMSRCKKVCEHLHLPLQSGSSRILKEMNRNYTKEHYLELVEKVRKAVPGISLTTDIIVGFPGEEEEDFKDTLDVVNKVGFDSAYTFLYSKRAGTPAAKREYQVLDDVKKQRFDRLLETQNRISKEINDNLMGVEFEVLVEGLSKNSKNAYSGRTRTNKIVNFKAGEELVGKMVTVKIDKIQTWSLGGKVVIL